VAPAEDCKQLRQRYLAIAVNDHPAAIIANVSHSKHHSLFTPAKIIKQTNSHKSSESGSSIRSPFILVQL